jgi:diguanylate cyclase (GGDEF)-like protein
MAITWIAGASLMLLTVLLPHPNGSASRVLIGVSLAGYAGAAAMLRLRRLALWLFELLVALGTALVVTAVIASGEGDGPYASFYMWITVEAVYFLPRRHAAFHVAAVAASYLFALLVTPSSGDAAVAYAMVVGTVVATGAFVDLVRRRIDSLVADLSHAARSDPLTGLLNRRGFLPLLEEQFELARRSGRELSLLAVDLDHFKELNDRLGHAAGDRALVAVAQALQSTPRRSDVVCRMGGDEFSMLLPDTGLEGAQLAAHRLRRAVHNLGVGLAASVGIAVFPRHAAQPEALLTAADRALYDAKRSGRDRAHVATSPEARAVGALAAAPGSLASPR